MKTRWEFRELWRSHPNLFDELRALRTQGYTHVQCAEYLWNKYEVRINPATLSQYLWRYDLLQQYTDHFWTPERIRDNPEEFSQSIHAFVHARSFKHVDPDIAKRLLEDILRVMRKRVEARERGEAMPPLSISGRGYWYDKYDPAPETVLRTLRLERQLTAEELALRANVPTDLIRRWERYGVLPNSLMVIARIADALGVPVETLLSDYRRYKRIDTRIRRQQRITSVGE
jgi:uncharacterized protein (DUF2267 family)